MTNDCSICLDPLKEQPCIKLTKCGHVHHRKCITKWFKIEKTCPLCRTIVMEGEDIELHDHVPDTDNSIDRIPSVFNGGQIKQCKNVPKGNNRGTTYTGTEPSPKGLGWAAKYETVGKKRKGLDGKMYEIRQGTTGAQRWTLFKKI